MVETLEVVDSLLRSSSESISSESELVVNSLGGGGGTKLINSSMGMRELSPSEGLKKRKGQEEKRKTRKSEKATHGVSLNRHDGSTVGKNRELVVLVLRSEDFHARHRDNTSLDSLLLEDFSGLDSECDFRSGTEESDGSVLLLVEDVSSLVGLLDRGTLELGKVLTGEGEDGRSVGGGEGHVVSSGGLVTVYEEARRGSVTGLTKGRKTRRGEKNKKSCLPAGRQTLQLGRARK